MNIVPLVLQVIALIAFLLAWFNRPFPKERPWNLIACGLFFWLLSLMIGGYISLHPVH